MTRDNKRWMIDDISASIQQAKSIVVLTGAGLSAESGIPTFRDALNGLWAKFDAQELATLQAFKRNPARVTQWYDERRQMCRQCAPNPGHIALAQLQAWCKSQAQEYTLITQNVDGLHQAAGSKPVIELHGNLWLWWCLGCGQSVEERGGPFNSYPILCACGGLRRPGVVWFGEMLPESALIDAGLAINRCDLFLSLGTSSVVEPAASFVYAASERGAVTVEINPEATPISDQVDYSLKAKTGEVLPEIVRGVTQ